MNVISVIGCVIGVVSCIVGIATFTSAQVTKAKQDGMLIAKIDQCVNGIEEIKKDMKEKNREIDKIINGHSQKITELQSQVENIIRRLG